MVSALRGAATRHALSVAASRTLARPHTLNRPRPRLRLLAQSRTKGTTAKKDEKKAAIARAIRSKNEAASLPVNEAGEPVLVFGLRPIDYAVKPPIRNPPPPPPAKPGLQKFLLPATILFSAATFGYFYVNNKNDNYDYWRAMQTGEALQMDDEEYDDDEEEEEEEVGEGEEQAQSKQVEEDTTNASKKRGWIGWLRRRKQGSGGDEAPQSDR